jgi:hypothetical protein
VTRQALPEATWDEGIHAYTDPHFREAAQSVYSSSTVFNDLDKSDYIAKIDENLEKIYGLVNRWYPESYPLTGMILELDVDFPLMNVFGMALANGDTEKISETWTHCIHAIWNEFSVSLQGLSSRENTLRLCRILDLINEFESAMIELQYFTDNYIPLIGLDYWFGDLTKLVDKYLKHEDILALSNTAGGSTLAAMHSSVPTPTWLGEGFIRGDSFLANNPNLPSDVVNRALSEREWGTSEKVLLHPNANTADAIEWVIEILESGEGYDLARAWLWYNVRDDLFNGFNSYQSTSKSGKKVLSAIKKWCKENPDEGQEIYEMLFEDA